MKTNEAQKEVNAVQKLIDDMVAENKCTITYNSFNDSCEVGMQYLSDEGETSYVSAHLYDGSA